MGGDSAWRQVRRTSSAVARREAAALAAASRTDFDMAPASSSAVARRRAGGGASGADARRAFSCSRPCNTARFSFSGFLGSLQPKDLDQRYMCACSKNTGCWTMVVMACMWFA